MCINGIVWLEVSIISIVRRICLIDDVLCHIRKHVEQLSFPDPLQLLFTLLGNKLLDTTFPAKQFGHAEDTHH